jgi:hypothetical protein
MDGIGWARLGLTVVLAMLAIASPAAATLTFQAKLTGPGGAVGHDVALSADGNTALVGAAEEALVFTRTGTTWTQQAKLTAPAGSEVGSGHFGATVALSSDGNTALIGGYGDNANRGAAWTFTRTGTTWTERQKLLAPATGATRETGPGEFGSSVTLASDGATAFIGGPMNASNTGAEWVWTRSGNSFTLHQKLVPAVGEEVGGGEFGFSAATSADGSTVLIGAPDDSGVGAVWVFNEAAGNWSETIELKAPTSGPDQALGIAPFFGGALAVSSDGKLALIAGPGDNSFEGATWAFTNGGAWLESKKLIAPVSGPDAQSSPPLFGDSLALSADGTTALFGGSFDSAESGNGVGAAWVGTRTGASWSIHPKLIAPTSGPGAEVGAANFGTEVALSSDAITALIGGPNDNSSAGAAWVFADPPSISGISPPSGPAGGGAHVTITGSRFAQARGVSFGGVPASSFTVVSTKQIDAVAPPGPPAPVDVTVTTVAGTSSTGLADRFTYFPSPPGAPGAVRATAGNRQAIVRFTAALSNGSGITSYRVTASPGGASATGSSSPITVSGLKNGTRYTFTVTATNGLGTGPASAPSNAVTPKAPPPSASHVALNGLGKRKPRLSFTISAGRFGQPLKSVAISLPRGLSFSKSRVGITVKGSGARRVKFTLRRSRGVLTITLRSTAPKARVTIASPSLAVTRALSGKVRRRTAGKLTIRFKIGDSHHVQTRLNKAVTPS